RRDLPGWDGNREVPGRHHRYHAERLPRRVKERQRIGRWVVLAGGLLRFTGEVAQDLHRLRRLADPLLEGLALLARQLATHVRDAGLEAIGGFVQDVGPRHWRAEAPRPVRLLGGGDRGIHVLPPG